MRKHSVTSECRQGSSSTCGRMERCLITNWDSPSSTEKPTSTVYWNAIMLFNKSIHNVLINTLINGIKYLCCVRCRETVDYTSDKRVALRWRF